MSIVLQIEKRHFLRNPFSETASPADRCLCTMELFKLFEMDVEKDLNLLVIFRITFHAVMQQNQQTNPLCSFSAQIPLSHIFQSLRLIYLYFSTKLCMYIYRHCTVGVIGYYIILQQKYLCSAQHILSSIFCTMHSAIPPFKRTVMCRKSK